PHKQIVRVLDRAGWHSSQRLRVPDYIHLLFLPPYSPDLQPAEHWWPHHLKRRQGPRRS
ncbi:MAG TPA: transposase, partial [Ktedonobacterales bacterium]